ncbi:MAG: hypothetical protein DRR15_06570, partial [Gammaproteobacteria bacterium]
RGNLYQVAIVPNEAARQRQEVATPSGLAMTSVFSGLQRRLFLRARNDVGAIRPLSSGIALQRLYDQV